MGQRRGAYAPEFRQQMVKLVKAGRKPSELAKELGCHGTSISGWVRQANADEVGGGRPDATLTTIERQELAKLGRQLRQITQECDILAKAGPSLPTRAEGETRRLCADSGKSG